MENVGFNGVVRRDGDDGDKNICSLKNKRICFCGKPLGEVRACETMSCIFDGKMNFLSTAIMAFQARPGMEQYVRFIVVRYFDESVPTQVKDKPKYREYAVRKQFHGNKYTPCKNEKQGNGFRLERLSEDQLFVMVYLRKNHSCIE